MIYVINFADEKYKVTQKYNVDSAYRHGADVVYAFGPDDIEEEFREKNREILAAPKGRGYWAWKPYFINKILEECKEDDWIIYSDSGLYFNRNIPRYIERYIEKNQYFVVRETKFLEKQFTKEDVFYALECEDDKYRNTRQLAATVIVLKNCAESRRLIAEYLTFSQNEMLISDDAVKQNCEEYVENRHDQSILSLLCKKRGGVSVDNNLFLDIVLPSHKRALLTYHHSVYGHKYQMFIASVHRVLKIIFS